jgi:hypothetical protein
MRKSVIALGLLCSMLIAVPPADAQVRDNVWNGALIGGAIGAGAGIALAQVTRDSELGAKEYGYAALVFGGIGAGVGIGIDALLFRNQPRPPEKPPRVVIAPAVSGKARAVAVRLRW